MNRAPGRIHPACRCPNLFGQLAAKAPARRKIWPQQRDDTRFRWSYIQTLSPLLSRCRFCPGTRLDELPILRWLLPGRRQPARLHEVMGDDPASNQLPSPLLLLELRWKQSRLLRWLL